MSLLKAKYHHKYMNEEDDTTMNYVQSFASCGDYLTVLHESGIGLVRMADWEDSMISFYDGGEWALGM